MNERELGRREAWSKKERETAAALAEIGIKPAEASLFHVVHFGLTVPPSDLCRRAVGRDYTVGGPVTIEENEAALSGCLSKGWLQIVDEAVLGRLQDEIRRNRLLGPVYDYPSLGGVEFTDAGGEQWFRICERLWNGGHDKSFAYCDVVHDKTAHYFLSESTALAEFHRSKGYEDVVSVTGPFPIGPWRANWWRRFPEGYHIDVEERRRWQGRCSDGGGEIFFDALTLPIDLAHANDVLNRHNVAWVEWLVMASLEHTTELRGIVCWAIKNSTRLGVNLTEAICYGSLEACLRNEWLRQVDDHVIAEIHNLLRADSAVMPVPFDPARQWVDVDFTAAGAQLYRIVSAEIFGKEWEDSLRVDDPYFREEHHYCATEAGLLAVQEQYAESGETPKAIRTMPIGPWCVYWWQRFSSGYRMEVTFGEP